LTAVIFDATLSKSPVQAIQLFGDILFCEIEILSDCRDFTIWQQSAYRQKAVPLNNYRTAFSQLQFQDVMM
jgi:hypothetical protein